MTKPTALALAKRQLVDSIVVDIRKGVGGALVVSNVLESPAPVRPGRYHLIDGEEMQSLTRRITAAEASAQLKRLMRRTKAAGTHTKRR